MDQQPRLARKPSDAPSGEQKQQNPELVTISQLDLNRKMAKQKGQGERAILSQLGLAAKEQLPEFLRELQCLRAAGEAQQQTASQLAQLTCAFTALQERCRELCGELKALQEAQLLRGAGVPEQELEFYAFMSHKLVREQGLGFAEALEVCLRQRPVRELPPPLYLAAGRAETRPVTGLKHLAQAAESGLLKPNN